MAALAKKRQNRISIRVLQGIVIALFLIFFSRLAQLQILDHETYGPLSRENILRQEHVQPARGLIFDRNGHLLVDNQPIYSITITPASFNRKNIPMLAELTGSTDEEIERRILAAQRFSWHRSSRLFTDVDFAVFSAIEENIWRLPGINHQIESKRNYPTDVRASHILGYLREVTDHEFRSSTRYRLGDQAGRTGLENRYEKHLRGDLGARYVRVNAYGQALGPYDNSKRDVSPVKGADMHTTLDLDLQLLAEKLMKNKVGGLVALDPRTGGILSMVSSPQFDVSKLSGRLDRDYWISINSDTTNPLFNRAISTQQPPGSTIKPLMGLLGMRMGLVTPQTEIACNGGYRRGRLYRCTDNHGMQNLVQAIQNSCNTYFFRLMDLIVSRYDLNTWHSLASDFSIGRRNNIDLPNETAGILPDSSYYNRVFGPRLWGVGDLISLGVGQGSMSTSPLHMALITAEIANGGYSVRPHLVKSLVNNDGSAVITEPEASKISWVRDDQLDVVRQGMRKAVTLGSGRFYSNLPDVEIAGKTGTAQNPHGDNHGWFIAYAPYDDPEIAIAVLVENGGFGSVSAAPIASLLMEQYFRGEIRRQWVLDHVLNYRLNRTENEETE